MLLHQISASTMHGKYKKSHTKTINLKHLIQHGLINVSYLQDYILYLIFKIIFSTSSKSIKLNDNP